MSLLYTLNDENIIIGDNLYPGQCCGSTITTYTAPDNIIVLPKYCFAKSSLTDIILHDNITKIEKYCFESCYKLRSIKIPKNLTTIENNAFYFCTGLKNQSIILPDSLTTLGSSVFTGSDIASIEIPKNVSSIRYSIVDYCDYLKAFIIRNSTAIYDIYVSNASYPYFNKTPINDGNGYIYIPSNLIEQYKVATNWSTYANQFRVLEDYTVDGTITGAFDYSKI